MEPNPNYSAWQFWFGVSQYIIALLVAIFVWLRTRDRARVTDINTVKECTSKDIEGIKDTISSDIRSVGTRVTRLEAEIVSKDDLTSVYEKVNDLSKEVSHLSGIMKKTGNAVDMIHGHLLNSGSKSGGKN